MHGGGVTAAGSWGLRVSALSEWGQATHAAADATTCMAMSCVVMTGGSGTFERTKLRYRGGLGAAVDVRGCGGGGGAVVDGHVEPSIKYGPAYVEVVSKLATL